MTDRKDARFAFCTSDTRAAGGVCYSEREGDNLPVEADQWVAQALGCETEQDDEVSTIDLTEIGLSPSQ